MPSHVCVSLNRSSHLGPHQSRGIGEFGNRPCCDFLWCVAHAAIWASDRTITIAVPRTLPLSLFMAWYAGPKSLCRKHYTYAQKSFLPGIFWVSFQTSFQTHTSFTAVDLFQWRRGNFNIVEAKFSVKVVTLIPTNCSSRSSPLRHVRSSHECLNYLFAVLITAL